MIEILVLILTTQNIGKMMKAKGYQKAGKWQWMFVGGWIGGEILGAIIGALIGGVSDQAQCVTYVCALLGAILGGIVTYNMAKKVEPLPGFPLQAGITGVAATVKIDSTQQMQELQNLRDRGLITADEFEEKRKEILSRL